jgi:hypothetical protein
MLLSSLRTFLRGGYRSRMLSPGRRRVLELLADSPGGCTEFLLLAHGYPLELIAQLVETGLATAESEWIIPIDSTVSVIRIKITESGRLALEGP